MPYTATNDLNILNTSLPLDTEEASDLGEALRETRLCFSTVVQNEHNSNGTHKTVNGDVIVAGSIPGTALENNAVGSNQLAAGSVVTAALAANAVTATNIAANTITAAQVANKTITSAQMAGTTSGAILIVQSDGSVAEKTLTGATLSAAGLFTLGGVENEQGIAIFADIETSGTAGGTFTSGAWQLRNLNSTVLDSLSIWALSANTLRVTTPGTYYVQVTAPAYKVDLHQARIWDPINNVVLFDGQPAMAPSGSPYGMSSSTVEGVFEVVTGGSQSLQIQHRCTTTEATDGLGANPGFGDNVVYCRVLIIKIS